ncbi:MAG: HAD hydrolase-like protein [Chitinispirillales bacterium]|jgi:phosphoglycolate phosphatase|nr:HAD hydrolase-like protein [Chitinispirillales bacterium]
MRQFDHIIWDWNGTIIDDVSLALSILNTQLNENAREAMSLEEYRSCFTFPIKTFYERIGLFGTDEDFMKKNKVFIDRYAQKLNECRIHNGVIEVLDTFIRSGGTHSVLSVYAQKHLTEMARQLGIADKFTHIKGMSGIEGNSKVCAGVEHLSTLNCKTSRVLFVGDTTHDYEVASALGVQCALIPKGHQSKEVLSGCQALLLDSHEELLAYL